MQKDFAKWGVLKESTNSSAETKLYHVRQVWWCKLGANIGFEQDGTGEEFERPLLILSAMSQHTCYVAPLTTSLKKHKYRIPVGDVDGKQASALISQIRLIDTKRLVNKIGFLDQTIFDSVKKAVRNIF